MCEAFGGSNSLIYFLSNLFQNDHSVSSLWFHAPCSGHDHIVILDHYSFSHHGMFFLMKGWVCQLLGQLVIYNLSHMCLHLIHGLLSIQALEGRIMLYLSNLH